MITSKLKCFLLLTANPTQQPPDDCNDLCDDMQVNITMINLKLQL